MESNYPDPKLSLQPFDPDVFQRVWNRVMPDQEHSPIAVDAPTLPAVPTLSPAPEEAPEPAPEVPLTCLGEGSQRYVQTIRDMMEQTQGFLRILQRLSRRSAGRPARVLSALSADLRRDLRRLSTAHFLITGGRYSPRQSGAPLSAPLDQTLRTLFQQFHQRAAQVRSAAQDMGDPCLAQLFQELGDGAEFYAHRLRALLEDL